MRARCRVPDPTRPRSWGLGWRTARRGSAPGPASAANLAPRAKEREANHFVIPRSPSQAPAFLTCSSPGKANPGRGGTEGARVARLTGAPRPHGWKKDSVPGGGEPPPLSRVDRGKPGADGSVALPGAGSLRFGSAAFSFFRSPWSAWVTLFLFLDDWVNPTQEESHQAVVIVFHYLKIGGIRGYFSISFG